jgi:hypothetical protein
MLPVLLPLISLSFRIQAIHFQRNSTKMADPLFMSVLMNLLKLANYRHGNYSSSHCSTKL